DHWYCATLEGPRGASGAELAEIVRSVLPSNPDETITVSSFDNPVQAFAKAREQASEDDRILVFGSFSTVGPVLKELGRTV
ncbi:MAG TPA: bifunctional folylpolyglutamate synthase/dihydrofolate synthase, partial [Pusillimonas sp.]|nr:bifunctional folylpolyglutamate synthase/dihydrofolate synthase [Pusillimonas sp.]